jgi:transcription elongation factor Elf1
MQASDFTRDDCLVGIRRLRYDRLRREYVCSACGGRLVNKKADGVYSIACGRCKGQDFITEYQLQQQESDAIEILAGLPPELAALVK